MKEAQVESPEASTEIVGSFRAFRTFFVFLCQITVNWNMLNWNPLFLGCRIWIVLADLAKPWTTLIWVNYCAKTNRERGRRSLNLSPLKHMWYWICAVSSFPVMLGRQSWSRLQECSPVGFWAPGGKVEEEGVEFEDFHSRGGDVLSRSAQVLLMKRFFERIVAEKKHEAQLEANWNVCLGVYVVSFPKSVWETAWSSS